MDPSLTVESAPEGTDVPMPDAISTSATDVKEKPDSKRVVPTTTVKKTRIKKEDQDFELHDQEGGDDRIDLDGLNLPGGPISSRRKSDRSIRGWKKIELWIEEESPDRIILDDDVDIPASRTSSQEVAKVKVEDEEMQDVVPSFQRPPSIAIDNLDEERKKIARENRAIRRRRQAQRKTREEKEEMAREEIDLEVLRGLFLDQAELSVSMSCLINFSQKAEQRLLLLQLPLKLPVLHEATEDVTVKSENVKSENPSTTVSQGPPAGKVGQLRVHASGRTVLSYGGIDFEIGLAGDVGFAQDFVAIDATGQRKAWRLGNVGAGQEGGWLVGVPKLKGIHR